MFDYLDKIIGPEGLGTLFAVGFLIQTFCALIVNIFNTPAKDSFFGKLYFFIEKLAGLWSDKAKQKGKKIIRLDRYNIRK